MTNQNGKHIAPRNYLEIAKATIYGIVDIILPQGRQETFEPGFLETLGMSERAQAQTIRVGSDVHIHIPETTNSGNPHALTNEMGDRARDQWNVSGIWDCPRTGYVMAGVTHPTGQSSVVKARYLNNNQKNP